MQNFLDPEFLIRTLGLFGVAAIVFAESGLFFGFFLPGDSLLFTAGFLASGDYLNIWWLLLFSFIAAVLGDNVGYSFGKAMGPKLFTKEDSFFFNKRHISRSHVFFEKYGKKAIVLARFVPIVRTFVPILAGVGSMERKTFFKFNVIGGFIWTFLMTLAGYFLGKIVPNSRDYLDVLIIVIIIVSFLPAVREYLISRKHEDTSRI